MRITRNTSVVVLTIVTASALATALRPGATSQAALSRPGDDNKAETAKTYEPSLPAAPMAADEPARLRANEAYGKLPLSFRAQPGADGRAGQVSLSRCRIQSISDRERSRAFAAAEPAERRWTGTAQTKRHLARE